MMCVCAEQSSQFLHHSGMETSRRLQKVSFSPLIFQVSEVLQQIYGQKRIRRPYWDFLHYF